MDKEDQEKFEHAMLNIVQDMKDSIFSKCSKEDLLPVSAMPVVHLKTGNIYFLLQPVLNVTNAQDGQKMCLYVNMKGQAFVREHNEFWQKFRAAADISIDIKEAVYDEDEDEDGPGAA